MRKDLKLGQRFNKLYKLCDGWKARMNRIQSPTLIEWFWYAWNVTGWNCLFCSVNFHFSSTVYRLNCFGKLWEQTLMENCRSPNLDILQNCAVLKRSGNAWIVSKMLSILSNAFLMNFISQKIVIEHNIS